MNTPLYNAVKKFAKSKKKRFCMPSHKGKKIGSIFDSVFSYDLTELPETDNLYVSSGIIGQAEDFAAKIFKSKATCFCATGASSCVKAMLALGTRNGKKIICDRFCHSSVLDGIALLNLDPVWLYPTLLNDFHIPRPPSKEMVEKAILENGDASAVFITSPNYYGLMADIEGISQLCKKHKKLLLVDNSHGTHLAFMEDGKNHPNHLGADFVCDSAHKTLPVLTGGALLHINNDIRREDALSTLLFFSSTSPSYLIMASLDYAIAYTEKNKHQYKKLTERIVTLKAYLNGMGFLCLHEEKSDATRLTICTAKSGIDGYTAYDFLYNKNIACEMADSKNIVLILTPRDSEKDFSALLKAMQALKNANITSNIPSSYFHFSPALKALSVREALFSKTEKVNTMDSEGRIIAENITIYPPSVPIIIAGERITKEIIEIIKDKKEQINVII